MAGVCSGEITERGNAAVTNKNLLQYSWARTPAAVAAEALAQRQRLLNSGDKGDNSGDAVGVMQSIESDEVERFTDVILGCLDMLLISRRREISITRVLAFVKRLASLTLVVVSFTS